MCLYYLDTETKVGLGYYDYKIAIFFTEMCLFALGYVSYDNFYALPPTFGKYRGGVQEGFTLHHLVSGGVKHV